MNIIFIPHLPTLYGRRYNLAKALAQQGHEVHFIVWDMPYPLSHKTIVSHIINAGKSKAYKENDNFFVHQVRRLPFFFPILNGALFKYQIKKIYKNENAQLVISQSFTNETEPPLTLPLVYDMNDDHQAFADVYGSKLYRLGYKLLGVKSVIARQAKAALLVTVVSDKLIELAKKYNKNVVKIPNGVEAEAMNFNRENDTEFRRHSILYISTFGKWSQLDLIIETIDKLKMRYPNIHLNLVGEGTELKKAKQQVDVQNLKKYVTFYGKISDRLKIFRLISEAEVCLNISEKNAFRDAASPIKVMEYSALGKRVISTGLAEVVSLNFPNAIVLSDTKVADSLEQSIDYAFSQKANKAVVSKGLMERYSWDYLTKTLIKNVERLSR